MKRGSPVPKRDLTGLVCTAGMGVLVLLAWTTLPSLPLSLAPVPAELHRPAGDAAYPALAPMRADAP
jgi:hypothetical protein